MTTEQHRIGSGFGADTAAARLWRLSAEMTGIDAFARTG
jgi:hypothetical protein